MNRLVIIASVVGMACASASAQDPKGSEGGVDPTEQTLRVTSDPVLWKMLGPLMEKYKVACRLPLSGEDSNKNPHWTCLGNMACTYRMTVSCFDKKKHDKQVLGVEVTGFDNGSTNDLSSFTISYK